MAWIYAQVSFPSNHTAPVCQLLNSILYISTHYICSISEVIRAEHILNFVRKVSHQTKHCYKTLLRACISRRPVLEARSVFV